MGSPMKNMQERTCDKCGKKFIPNNTLIPRIIVVKAVIISD